MLLTGARPVNTTGQAVGGPVNTTGQAVAPWRAYAPRVLLAADSGFDPARHALVPNPEPHRPLGLLRA